MPSARKQPAPPALASVPVHVAIIMDGNGRWAKQRGLPRLEGHRRGARAVRTTLTAAFEAGVKYLTLYAFSVENWNRPQDEVGGLMSLLNYFLRQELKTLRKNKIALRTIGRTGALPPDVRKELAATIKATAHYKDRTLILALNYGSRTEIADAARAYAYAVASGKQKNDEASWDDFARHLYTAGIPDPDLVIRTSGETRISNFLLMQSAYAEFIFTPVLWPDFGKDELHACFADYARRERRYGFTSEQLQTNPAPDSRLPASDLNRLKSI
jgi:undecaprenyl diphosphate synthase